MMNIVLLGGIGGVSLEASRDIVAKGGYEQILLADSDVQKTRDLSGYIGLP